MVLAEKNITTHIFPFLWLHGEPHTRIYEEIKAIYDSGIRMFCVESRPHPEFCQEKWWKDFGFILETAERFGMKVWLLDDKHYPTGYANGAIERNPDLKAHQIRIVNIDFISEGAPCRFVVNDMENDDKLVGAFCFKRKGDGIDFLDGFEITDSLHENVLTVQTKSGFYRLVVLLDTTRFPLLKNLIDMLSPESAYLQIKEVYEPHYEKFKDKFGKTFVGFFSDEPSFFNGRSESNWVKKSFYETTLGLLGATYPYRPDLAELLGITDKKELIGLWYDTGKDCAEFRIRYMNAITRLYEENFSLKIGKWCEEHGVLYTGHINEDMGGHCRTGVGSGHFFRAMTGQHIAGIDVVLHQIECGYGHKKHFYPCSSMFDSPDFFHFTLAKLGVSAAHLEPKKKNRTMCEIFGAYGWGETLAQMKWLVDFMLVRGVNYFVPHAFNPKQDDLDCPPYFYHGGNNPLFGGFGALMKYTENLCVALSGEYTVDVGVLYHAEAEWSGKAYEPMDTVCRKLSEAQIDFEIVSTEYLDRTKCKILIVSYAEYLAKETEKALLNFKGKVIKLKRRESLFNALNAYLLRPYYLKRRNKDVRVLERNGKYFVFNEGIRQVENTLITPKGEYPLRLKAGEAVLLAGKPINYRVEEIELSDESEMAVKNAFEREFIQIGKGSYLDDLHAKKGYEKFVGTVKYTLNFTAQKKADRRYDLDFGVLSGGLKIALNGENLGYCFGSPYKIEITDQLKEENELVIELSTTLALKYKDLYSKYCRIDKCGLQKNILLISRFK